MILGRLSIHKSGPRLRARLLVASRSLRCFGNVQQAPLLAGIPTIPRPAFTAHLLVFPQKQDWPISRRD